MIRLLLAVLTASCTLYLVIEASEKKMSNRQLRSKSQTNVVPLEILSTSEDEYDDEDMQDQNFAPRQTQSESEDDDQDEYMQILNELATRVQSRIRNRPKRFQDLSIPIETNQPIPTTSNTVNNSTIQRNTREKWSIEHYRELMWCFFYSKIHRTQGGLTQECFKIWRERNPSILPHLDANTLTN